MVKITTFLAAILIILTAQRPLFSEKTNQTDISAAFKVEEVRKAEDTEEITENIQKSTQEKPLGWKVEHNPNPSHEHQNILWLATLDLLVPGYGMFSLKKFYWGVSYAIGKLLGFVFIGLSVNRYLFWSSIAEQLVTPTNLELGGLLDVPGSSPSTAQEILTSTNNSIIFIMFAVTFEILVSGMSLWHTWIEYKPNYKEGAYYRIDLEPGGGETKLNRMKLEFGYEYVF